MAMSKEAFDNAGGFDERLRPAYEDREFCERLFRNGVRFVYAPDARVGHNRVMTMRSFLAQHFGYGRGALAYYKKREHRSPRGTVPFLLRVMRAAAAESRGFGRLQAPLLVILSQIVALIGLISGALPRRHSEIA
jgi:GT2 family glycosyltransferase